MERVPFQASLGVQEQTNEETLSMGSCSVTHAFYSWM